MIDLNYLYGSILFYSFCKLASFVSPMYSKSKHFLTSIPENESDSDLAPTKWVPKKKHELLKAKYKCLKKLFQIYDASGIGTMPESCGQGDGFSVQERDDRKSRRKKRFHRARTDACAGTTDLTSEPSESAELDDMATSVNRDLKTESSNTITAPTNSKSNTTVHSEYKQTCRHCTHACEHECRVQTVPFQQPGYYRGEKRKLTRFQSFIQRILGIRREPYRGVVLNGHVLAASDDDINHRYVEKRRRRGLRLYGRRCRRLRRPKKVQSEGTLRDGPILDYAQTVQRNCLMDTTPRQCPIAGCRMMFYGIINYNDHLNLCHFTERRFVCHFCHEGFENEADKLHHESEHVGLSRLSSFMSDPIRSRVAVTSDTQTDPQLTAAVQEEKLKKIVSFFDKFGDSEQMLSGIKQNRCSESALKTSSECASSFKRMPSCVEACRPRAREGDVKCTFCGEGFEHRRQLSLHVDLEHRIHDKFSKFHSCAGMMSAQPTAGQLTITSAASTLGCPSISRASSVTSVNDAAYAASRRGLGGRSPRWEPGSTVRV